MKQAKLFMNGQSQAVRLPKEFRLPGNTVHIKRLGNAIILLPIENPWANLIQSLDHFSEDFMEDRNQPETQIRKECF